MFAALRARVCAPLRADALRSAGVREADATPPLRPPFFCGCVICLLADTRAALIAAPRHLVHRGPGVGFGRFLGSAALAVAFFDVLRLTFLFVGIADLSPLGMVDT